MLGGSQLFGFACVLIFITVSVVCGVIKYFHVCPPYESDLRYYYPVRKTIVLLYLSPLFLIPALVCPFSEDAWLFGRAFLLLGFGVPLVIATERHYGRTSHPMLARIEMTFVLVMEAIGCLLSILDLDILKNNMLVYYILVAILWVYMHARVYNGMRWLHLKIKGDLHEMYSCEDDFRNPFTHAVLWMLIPFFVVTFIAFVSNSHTVVAIVLLLISIRFIVYLLFTLSSVKVPKFTIVYDNDTEYKVVPLTVEEKAQILGMAPDPLMESVPKPNFIANAGVTREVASVQEHVVVAPEVSPEIIKQRRVQMTNKRHAEQITKLMEEQQMFLKVHLTVDDVAKALRVNSTYVREACKVNYDNFFDMVNSYRIEYAKKFAQDNPNYSREAIALASGFGSYRSYLRAEEKYSGK